MMVLDSPANTLPHQAAWMSFGPMPASSKASYAASTIMSSRLLFQFSPNLTQPMPTMATLSLMLSTATPPPLKSRFAAVASIAGWHFHQ